MDDDLTTSPTDSPAGSLADSLADSLAPLRQLAREGELRLPEPAGGATWQRWQSLAAWARRDVAAARIIEAHVDACSILAALGHEAPAGLLGVWAAESVDCAVVAARVAGGWELDGVKRWCSGASFVDAALITAHAHDGRRLFLVRRETSTPSDHRPPGAASSGPSYQSAPYEPIDGTWTAVGMDRTDSRDVVLHRIHVSDDAAVGEPGGYLGRPGFWHGAAGVAACWYGGAVGVADALTTRARARPDPHTLAHLGAVTSALRSARAVLESTAHAYDNDPKDADHCAERLALTARSVVERVATEVIDRVGRATGAQPLGHDAAHARRVHDLLVYLRQSHAEQDLARLGELVLAGGDEDSTGLERRT